MISDETKTVFAIIVLVFGLTLITGGCFSSNKNISIVGVIITTGVTSWCWYKLCKTLNNK